MALTPVVGDLVAQDADEPGADGRLIAESLLVPKSGEDRFLNEVLDGGLIANA